MAEPPTAEEWEDQRNTIIGLYIGGSMSVPRLRRYMRSQYNFDASPKMYRSRFRKWGVRKYTYHNCSTAVTDETSELAIKPAASRQPVAIPAFSSRVQGQTNESPSPFWHYLGPSLRGVQIRHRVHGMPQPPDIFYVPEKCLKLLQSYVKGSSEGMHWPRDDHGSFLNEDVVPSWCSPLMSAAWVLKEGKLESATMLLGKFIDQSPRQLARQDPLIFAFVYTSLRLPDAEGHPLRTLILLLCQLGPAGIVQNASRILLAYVEFIQAELGAACPLVQDMMSDAIMRLIAGRLIGAETATEHIRRMMTAAEAQGWHRCRYYLQLKMHQSMAYLNMGQPWYAEARRTAEEVTEDQYADFRDNGLNMDYHMLMCKINEAEGRWEDAKLSALRAVTTSMSHFGKDSDWAANTLIVYRRILRRMGEDELAEKVAEDRDFVIGRLCER